MRAVILIAVKELRQRVRDRSLLMFALILPFGLAALFNVLLGGVGGARAFDFALADEDHGAQAALFSDHVLAPAARSGAITIERVPTGSAARARVERGQSAAAFVIPTGFTAAVQSGRGAAVRIVGDVDSPIAVQVARSIAEQYTERLNGVRLSVITARASGAASAPEELAGKASAAEAAVRIEAQSAERRELTGTTYLAAGMAVFFLFFTVQFGGLGLLEERDTGTLPRLLAAPVRPATLLAGKLLAVFVVGVTSMTVLAVASSLLLDAHWGDPAGLALLIPAGVLAATGIMAVVASLARTAEQAGSWHAVIAVTLGALGGTFFPVAQVGGLVEKLSLLTPHRWFLSGLADLSGGAGVGSVWGPVAALCGCAVITAVFALIRFRRELEV